MLPVTTQAKIETLRKARQYLVDHGWVRGAMFRMDGRMCLLGALGLSAGYVEVTPDSPYVPFSFADGVLEGELDSPWAQFRQMFTTIFLNVRMLPGGLDSDSIARFNDERVRRVEDIYQLIDDAIAFLENQLELTTPHPLPEEPEVAEERELVLA
jgi:hypothetical protein